MYRLLFSTLAQTGLRISECLALQWGDLDFGKRRLKVQRRLYRGSLDSPKTKESRGTVPLSTELAQALWTAKANPRDVTDDAFVFAGPKGQPLDRGNLFRRVLKPTAIKAGLGTWKRNERGVLVADSWVGFHTFRHTAASILFRAGWSPKQTQMFLGHSDPGFTLGSMSTCCQTICRTLTT